MDNIQNVPEELDALKNSTSYILKHSKINKNNDLYFNISGIIDKKPKFGKVNIKLMTYTKSENEVLPTEIDCNIIDIINYDYILNCKGNNNEYYNLQNSLSFIDDEILVINFDNNGNSIISFEESKKNNNINYKSKKKVNFNAGVIVAIILAVIVVISGTIITCICLRKRKNKELNNDSTFKILKIWI